jgi:hypothetical protein
MLNIGFRSLSGGERIFEWTNWSKSVVDGKPGSFIQKVWTARPLCRDHRRT